MVVGELWEKIDAAEALVISSPSDQRDGILAVIFLREIVKAIEELEMSSQKK